MKEITKIVSGVVLTALVSSCGIYTQYKRPEVNTENLYRVEETQSDSVSIADLSWDELFTDTDLQSLIQEGLQSNTDLNIARLKVKEALQTTFFSLEHPVYRANSKELREILKNEMLYIVEHCTASKFHLIGHLYLFLDALTQSTHSNELTSSSKISDYYIKEAIHYIEQNFQNDISIEEIARVCGINRSYFGKIFRKSIGKSPQEFLMNYRMIKATELLSLTSLSISEISQAVGYDNPLHFSRAFKNVYGISPRTWRKENK